MITMKRYKLMIIPTSDVDENTILISETMRHNLQNALHCEQLDESCFMLSSGGDVVDIAAEARISLIANPKEYENEMISVMLQNYFLYPRHLHVNDVFGIGAMEYAQDQFYSSGLPTMPVIYFLVKSLKLHRGGQSSSVNSCYVVYGESTLIQEAQIHSYVPRKHVRSFPDNVLARLNEETRKLLNDMYPSALMEPLEYLESCIMPFLKEDIQLHVKPTFLVKGPQGCGKRELIQIMSERTGLHLFDVDFAEMQTLLPAQVENKIRLLLLNARKCVPCVLYLNNIQVFGKTAEGQKDDRIISAFSSEVDALYHKRQRFPLIIVAATDETEMPAELQRVFVETIRVNRLNHSKRAEFVSWFLSNKNLTTVADVSKVAGLCSDFRFADLLALSLHAAKLRYKLTPPDSRSIFTLTQEDFDRAYECMQSMYSDSRGAPRIPEVHWEDIGGLAELKREITRRIQLPLLNAFGFGQSGLLLYGPPGTGKTLLAKAVATEYQLHFLSIKGPEVLNMYVGESEKNVRQIFEGARSAAPCIIFFDELDSLAPNRGRSGDSGGVMDRVVSQLLAEMDGLEESSGIFIMGATNRPDLLDPALLRPGRFDKMLYVGIYSDRASQLSVLQAQTRKFEFYENGRELESITDWLPGNVTGADLYSVSSNAWLNAVREVLAKYQAIERIIDENQPDEKKSIVIDSVVVKLQHFLDAVRNLVPSVSKEEMERYNRMRMELSSP
ncbi:Peroxisomal biogenesis factor [Ooceraea biroi]|nr:Peroxisomal biogenesis factor [Ooceraea biroi]